MSEQNNANIKRTIEDVIKEKLTGKTQQNALDYVAFLKANEIIPDEHGEFYAPAYTQYSFDFDNGFGCLFGLFGIEHDTGSWGISTSNWDSVLSHSEYQNFPIDENVKEFAWAHVRSCTNFTSNGKECGCGFQPGRYRTVFGKDFYHTCHGGLEFINPDGEGLELLKKLTVVLGQIIADAAKNDKPYMPRKNEWLSVKDIDVHTSHSLKKAYTKSLDVQFFITPRCKYVNNATIGFSGGEWVPATRQQIPIGLRFGSNSRIEAYKGPTEGWRAVETLKYQANVIYFVEISINITDKTYNTTVWMLDANSKQDTPYFIAKDFPFRLGGDPAIPAITAIDTVYLGQDNSHTLAFIVKDFKVVGGE